MYTRSYYSNDEKLSVPENYDGNAFGDEKKDIASQSEEKETYKPVENNIQPPRRETSEKTEAVIGNAREGGLFNTILQKSHLGNIFGKIDIFKNGFSDIGTEEILIVGIALFLLFSKSGDKECAVMLLLLLFVR